MYKGSLHPSKCFATLDTVLLCINEKKNWSERQLACMSQVACSKAYQRTHVVKTLHSNLLPASFWARMAPSCRFSFNCTAVTRSLNIHWPSATISNVLQVFQIFGWRYSGAKDWENAASRLSYMRVASSVSSLLFSSPVFFSLLFSSLVFSSFSFPLSLIFFSFLSFASFLLT